MPVLRVQNLPAHMRVRLIHADHFQPLETPTFRGPLQAKQPSPRAN
jgi:hypothetical protein